VANVVEMIFRARNEASSGIRAVTAEVEGLGKSLEGGAIGSVLKLGGAFAALEVVHKVVEWFGEFIAAGKELQETNVALSSALEGLGQNASQVAPKINEMVESLQKASRFDSEGIRRAMTSLIQSVGQAAESEKVLAATADLAAARHMDIEQAAMLVEKAINGQAMALQRAGVFFDDTTKKALALATVEQGVALVTGNLNEKFGGASVRDMASYTAQVQHLRNAIHDWKAEIGERFVENFSKSIVDLKQNFAAFNEEVEKGNTLYGAYLHTLEGGSQTMKQIMAPQGQAVTGLTPQQVKERREANAKALKDEAQAILDNEQKKKDAAAAEKKRLEEQAAQLKAYRNAVDTLLGVSTDQLQAEKALSEAVREVDARMGAGEGAKTYAEQLKQINDAATRLHRTLSDSALLQPIPVKALGLTSSFTGLSNAMEDPVVAENKARDQRLKDLDEFVLHYQDLMDEVNAEIAKEDYDRKLAFAAQLQQKYADQFVRPIGSIFADLAATGGKHFGEIAGGFMRDSLQRGGEELAKILGDALLKAVPAAFGGGEITAAPGTPEFAAQTTQKAQQQQKIGAALTAAVGGITQLAGVISGKGPHQSAAELILGQTATGASIGSIWPGIGTVIGAVVGLVVGGIAALTQGAAGDKYSYATGIGVNAAGQATFRGNQNVTANKASEALAQIQQTFDTFWDGYMNLILKLPLDFLPKIDKAISPMVGRFEQGADFGFAASEKFWEEFDEYVKGKLPTQIASKFRDTLGAGFEKLGLSASTFNRIWNELAKLDPKQALSLWTALAEGMTKIHTALDYFATPVFNTSGGRDLGLFGLTQRQEGQTFADQLRGSTSDIMELAGAIGSMTSQGQIQAAQQLGTMLEDRMNKEKAFLSQVSATIKAITQQMDDSIRSLTLEGFKTPTGETDYKAQAEYLKSYADDLRNRIRAATTPEEAQQLGSELNSVIMQIVGLGKNADPATAEAYRQWGIAALKEAKELLVARLEGLAAAVTEENRAFLESFRPLFEGFSDDVHTNLQLPIKNLSEDFDGASTSVRNWKTELDATTERLVAFRTSLSADGGGSKGTQSVQVSVVDGPGPTGPSGSTLAGRRGR
jgi:hypothetical protein